MERQETKLTGTLQILPHYNNYAANTSQHNMQKCQWAIHISVHDITYISISKTVHSVRRISMYWSVYVSGISD